MITKENILQELCKRSGKTEEEISLTIGKKVKAPFVDQTYPSLQDLDENGNMRPKVYRVPAPVHRNEINDSNIPRVLHDLHTAPAMLRDEDAEIAKYLKGEDGVTLESLTYALFCNFLAVLLDDSTLWMNLRESYIYLTKLFHALPHRRYSAYRTYNSIVYPRLREYHLRGSEREYFVKHFNGMLTEDDIFDAFTYAFELGFSENYFICKTYEKPTSKEINAACMDRIELKICNLRKQVSGINYELQQSDLPEEEKQKIRNEILREIREKLTA